MKTPDRVFSYARPTDPLWQRMVIRSVEKLTGSKELQRIYRELYEETPNAFDVWGNAFRKLRIELDYDEDQLAQVPRTGPIIFVANHPFGVVDGAYFLHLVTRVRKDYFLLINEVLAHEPIVEGHLLPVDFRNTPAAKATNLETKRLTTQRLSQGECLVIFPSGGVATARPPWGETQEFPWRTFICQRIHETKCTVVPIYFHGRNSRMFHYVSHISMNLRLGLLLHEIKNKKGQRLRAEIGNPIAYTDMAPHKDKKELIKFLYDRTMMLGK